MHRLGGADRIIRISCARPRTDSLLRPPIRQARVTGDSPFIGASIEDPKPRRRPGEQSWLLEHRDRCHAGHRRGVSELTPRTSAWKSAGAVTPIAGGRQIFVHERDGARDRPPVLFLHGCPSSSYDWRHALQSLGGRRLILFDFLGFGLSQKPPGEL